jgi:uncharacterized protein YjbI with pentapeptide repeats
MEALKLNQVNQRIEASEAMLEDSTFTMVCLNRLQLNDVSAVDIRITNANLTNLEIEGAQLGGAFLHNIGMPLKGHPHYDENAKQQPLHFESCDLNGTTINNCDLSNVSINNCNTIGMYINGILVYDLLKAYQRI